MKDVSYRPQSNQDSKAEGAQSSQQGAMIGKGLALKDLWIWLSPNGVHTKEIYGTPPNFSRKLFQ